MKILEIDGFRFACETQLEVYRATTLLTKEPGTIQWIRQNAHPGDVIYDIGANIGIYTLIAAQVVGPTGRIFAIEPHVANANSLMRNVVLNGFADRVCVLTCALHDHEGFFDFAYRRATAGSSGHQLGHTAGEDGRAFLPVVTERKYATTVDRLVKDGVIVPAALIKIDVDGNELAVLRGMTTMLENPVVRSVQVEIHPTTRREIVALMATCGFDQVERHDTMIGQAAIHTGMRPESVIHNLIFSTQSWCR